MKHYTVRVTFTTKGYHEFAGANAETPEEALQQVEKNYSCFSDSLTFEIWNS